MAIKKIENIEHYSWGHNYDGWELFRSNSLCVIQEKMPARSNEGTQFIFMITGDRKHLIS